MLQSNRKGGPRVGSSRPETRPFVKETLPIRGQSVSVEGVPSQARGTPLPKPALDLKPKKAKRESSLLGLVVPKFGRKKEGRAPAPPSGLALRETAPMFRPDPTLEVSQSDIVLDSSTQELDVADLSIDASQSTSFSPATHRPPRSRRHGPWVVWGLVGGAWCVMIALALLAVEDSSKSSMRADAAVRVTHEQATMGAITAEEHASEARMPSLETTAPAAQALKDEAAAKPQLEAAAVGALNPASTALGESEKPALAKREQAARTAKRSTVEKRRAAKRKHKAQFQKRHKKKKTRHAKRRAKKG
jgi:hypothetical protein